MYTPRALYKKAPLIKRMSDERYPCKVCGRNFNPESLTKHERICIKQTTKKPRKVFDSGRQRAAGSDIPYSKTLKPGRPLAPASHSPAAPPPYSFQGGKTGMKDHVSFGGAKDISQGKPKSNWRKQHEEFLAAVRAAKAYGQAVKSGGPLPPPAPPSENPDYVMCPTCGRRFNETAAQRHIPFCAEKSNRVPASRRVPDTNAKMRANARGYVAPLPGAKPKSTSGGGGRGSLMGTTTLSGANDYAYDSYSPSSSSQAARYAGAPQNRRAGPSVGSGGAAGRMGASRQIVDDEDFESYQMPGPRGARLGGGIPAKNQPGSSGSRLAPVSGVGRGSMGGSSAVGMRNQGASVSGQGIYLGSNGIAAARGGGGSSGSLGGNSPQFCYECGNQYPSKVAKFCVECGAKKM